MKVLYDARWILIENRFDGVSRYSHELAHALAKQKDIEVAWLIHDKRQLAKLPKGKYVMANDPNDILRETFQLPRTINKSGYELVYSPFFMMGTLGKKYKLVLTIHDMIYFTHRTPPQWLPWYVRLGWWLYHTSYAPMRWQLNRADMVATVSETARQELIDANVTKRDIMTVSNAVSKHFEETADERKSHGPHYTSNEIVYMGAFTPYKNVECLIDALALVPGVTLHLCGKMPKPRRNELEARMEAQNVRSRIVIHDGATDEQYKQALSNARCSISASRLEGFGLPVLEAQQRGVPMVVADTPIFHEVADNAALFFNPDSPKQAAKAIKQLADPEISERMIAAGFLNAKRYSWENSAKVAKKILQQIS